MSQTRPAYVFGVDFISITEECDRLARNNGAVGDFTPEQVQAYQFMRHSEIRMFMSKDEWQTTDRDYGATQLIETNLVASDILEHYGDVNSIPLWQAMRADAIAELKAMKDNLQSTATDSAAGILSTGNRGWNGCGATTAPPNRMKKPLCVGDTEGIGHKPYVCEVDL